MYVGHIQYISNIVRHIEEWRQAYGVHYILDTIRVFYRYNTYCPYCPSPSHKPLAISPSPSSAPQKSTGMYVHSNAALGRLVMISFL